jgi:hypothetical protein
MHFSAKRIYSADLGVPVEAFYRSMDTAFN